MKKVAYNKPCSESEAARKTFCADLIEALRFNEKKLATKVDNKTVALQAYQSLQFDFPEVSEEGLHALATLLRTSFASLYEYEQVSLTRKVIANICLLARSRPKQTNDVRNNSSSKVTTDSIEGEQRTNTSVQRAYQHLCATSLVHLLAHCLDISDTSAWSYLHKLSHNDDGTLDNGYPCDEIVSNVLLKSEPTLGSSNLSSAEDGDDFVFEALENFRTIQTSIKNASSSKNSSPPAYSWPAYRDCLFYLASSVNYSLLSHEDLWKDGTLQESVVHIIDRCSSHSCCKELGPVIQQYVYLLTDYLIANTDQLKILDKLWDILQLRSCADTSTSRPFNGKLPDALEIAFYVVGQLVIHLRTHSEKMQMWHHIKLLLAPASSVVLSELCKPQASIPKGDECVLNICQVLYFYLSEAPGNAKPALDLLKAGVLRSLAALLLKNPSGSWVVGIRSLIILSAATCPEARSYLVAVPGLSSALASPQLPSEDPVVAVQTAFWEMLAEKREKKLLDLLTLSSGGNVHALHGHLTALHTLFAAAGRKHLWTAGVDAALDSLAQQLRLSMLQSRRSEVEARSHNEDGNHQEAGSQQESGSQQEAGSADAPPAPSNGTGAEAHGTNEQAGKGRESNVDNVPDGGSKDEAEQKLHDFDKSQYRARELQRLTPECLRLIKDLLLSKESLGKTD